MKKMNEEQTIKGVRRQRLRDILHHEVRLRAVGVVTGVALGISTAIAPAFACTKSSRFVLTAAVSGPVEQEETTAVVEPFEITMPDETTTTTFTSINKNAIVTTPAFVTGNSDQFDSSKNKSDSTSTVLKTSIFTTTTTTTSTTTTTTSTTTTTTVTSETTTTTQTPPREYVVYKPSTHYVHMNTCRWYDSTCHEISSTVDVEARRCSECNPDIEIIHQYVPPTTTATTTTTTAPVTTTVVTNAGSKTSGHAALNYITETERIYLCNVVSYEYGADWVSLYDKGLVVACVMNRVRDGGWTYGKPSTIYNVLTAPYQFSPAYAVPYYSPKVTKSVIDAVDYYFENQSIFPRNIHSYWGDGRVNHFS